MHFNFHYHSVSSHGIKNIRVGCFEEVLDESTSFSAGIHPWDVDSIDLSKALLDLDSRLKQPKCLALGELGIDKKFGTNLDLQIGLLRSQLELALKHQKKVLIIHCIKAFQEIIEEKNKAPNDFIWVLHGFNGSKELIQQMLHQGFYFSLGALLFMEDAKIIQNIKEIPLDRLFLETDDSDLIIEEVYQRAAHLLNLNVNIIEDQLEQNLKQVFTEDLQIKNQ